MIAGFGWPDAVIALVVGLLAFKGWTQGFFKEVGGLVAMAAAVIAPHYYNGSADAAIASATKLDPASSHVVATILTGILAYAIVLAIAAVLTRIAKLPILNLANRIAGALVGFVKGAFLIWLALFIALFFPLTPEIRGSLHQSRLAPYFTALDEPIDAAIEYTMPPFVKPWLAPYFQRHHL